MNCWQQCGGKQGRCSWCGTHGLCCTKTPGWTNMANGCDGTFGGETAHECALPGKVL